MTTYPIKCDNNNTIYLCILGKRRDLNERESADYPHIASPRHRKIIYVGFNQFSTAVIFPKSYKTFLIDEGIVVTLQSYNNIRVGSPTVRGFVVFAFVGRIHRA